MLSLLSGVALFFIGILTGFFSGLFGGGGGIITNPLIWTVFSHTDFSPLVAVHLTFGTTVASMMIMSIAGSVVHFRHGNIWLEVVFPLIVGGLFGSLAGSSLACYSPGETLKAFFGFLQLAVAVLMIKDIKLNSSSDEPIKKWYYVMLSGLFVGFIGSYMGIGGGAIAVPLMVLLLRYPMDKTAGISCTMIAFNTTAATICYIYYGWGNENLPLYSLGYVHLLSLLILISSGILFAIIGASRVKQIKGHILRKIFGFVLIISGTQLVYANLPFIIKGCREFITFIIF